MSRGYVLVRLLQHGPLSIEELLAVLGASWNYRLLVTNLGRLQASGRVGRRDVYGGRYYLLMGADDALRGLRSGEQRAGAPAGVEPLQPGLHGLRGTDGVLHPAHAQRARKTAKRADEGRGRRLGQVGARRAGAARALHAGLEGLGHLGGGMAP